MKGSALVAILSASLSSVAVADNEADCVAKRYGDEYTIDAIYAFCSKQDIVVPSAYAEEGMHGGDTQYAFVNIVGYCTPPQWVPSDICVDQFFAICANEEANDRGHKERHYGRNGCQLWHIEHPPVTTQEAKIETQTVHKSPTSKTHKHTSGVTNDFGGLPFPYPP